MLRDALVSSYVTWPENEVVTADPGRRPSPSVWTKLKIISRHVLLTRYISTVRNVRAAYSLDTARGDVPPLKFLWQRRFLRVSGARRGDNVLPGLLEWFKARKSIPTIDGLLRRSFDSAEIALKLFDFSCAFPVFFFFFTNFRT